jgi:hypothetical protein
MFVDTLITTLSVCFRIRLKKLYFFQIVKERKLHLPKALALNKSSFIQQSISVGA